MPRAAAEHLRDVVDGDRRAPDSAGGTVPSSAARARDDCVHVSMRVVRRVLQHLVEQREVVDAPRGRLESRKPERLRRSSAIVCSDDAIGSSVNVMFLNDASTSSACERLAGDLVDAVARRAVFASRRVGLDEVDRVGEALDAGSRRRPGARRGTSCVTTRCVVTYLPSGHRSLSSTRILPPPSVTRRVAHGSGTHAPSIGAGLERGRASCELSCGTIVTSPPPVVSVLQPLLVQPRAERDVLRVAELRRRELLALQVGRRS